MFRLSTRPCVRMWMLSGSVASLLALAGCGTKQPTAVTHSQATPERETAMLQQQIQATEQSSLPPQIKQQVVTNLDKQIQAKQGTQSGH
jgi:uncharacterized protein YcfL